MSFCTKCGSQLLPGAKFCHRCGALVRVIPPSPPKAPPTPPKPTSILKVEFSAPSKEYPGRIAEVTLGATRADGGTRGKTVSIGGESVPPFHFHEGSTPNPPVVAGDVFDKYIPLPGPVRRAFGEDTLHDPIKWAKACVERLGVDLIDLELISTDPYAENTPVNESVKLVEEVLQAVDVPLIIGGSGNPEKDAELFPKVAGACEGERVLMSSATLDMWEPVAKAAKEHGQLVLAWSTIDMAQARELNRKLFDYIPKEWIVIDPTTAALGYGFEYAFSVIERLRLAALMGDADIQCPIFAACANAWGAREAWKKDPELGSVEYRGPSWETVQALSFLLAGSDLFVMLHPGAMRTMKDVISWLMGERTSPTFPNWIGI